MTNAPAHKFEVAGLGTRPFICVGMWTMPSNALLETNPTAYNMALANRPHDLSVGSCAYCGMGLIYNYIIKNSEGRRFVVGCECVNKTGDEGLVREVKRARVEHKQRERQAIRDVAKAEREAAYQAMVATRAAEFETCNSWLIETATDLGLLDRKGEFVSDVISAGRCGRYVSEKARTMVTEAVRAAKFRHDNPSCHVGTEGKRETFEVTVERVNYFDTAFGTKWVLTMRDARGNAIVSKSTSFHRERGTKLRFKATIKEHSEFRGELQTIVQRIKVED